MNSIYSFVDHILKIRYADLEVTVIRIHTKDKMNRILT